MEGVLFPLCPRPTNDEGLLGRNESLWDSYFHQLMREIRNVITLSSSLPEINDLEAILWENPGLFSGQLGTVGVAQYDKEVVDDIPLKSMPYHCVPPKLKILMDYIDEHLEKGVKDPLNRHMRIRRF